MEQHVRGKARTPALASPPGPCPGVLSHTAPLPNSEKPETVTQRPSAVLLIDFFVLK